MTVDTDRVYFTIRMDRSARERLHSLGRENFRSASREAELAITRHIELMDSMAAANGPVKPESRKA